MPKDGSLLEEYFGPRATVSHVQNNVPKYDWRCEEQVTEEE